MNEKSSVDLTISDSDYLRLAKVQRFKDHSGWSAMIDVGTGYYSCSQKKIYFDNPTAFVADLKNCSEKLSGFAELKSEFEQEFIRFSFDHMGKVRITGVLYGETNLDTDFRYGIPLDQTFLPNYIKAWESLLAQLDV